MRILFASTSGLGHIHPMIPLAHALQARGHEVRWATGPESLPRLHAAGIDALPAGVDAPIRMQTFRQRYPEVASMPPAEQPNVLFPKIFGEIAAPPMLADLLPITRGWQPHLIVRDAADFAAPIAAAAIGVPCVTHSFGALTPPDRAHAASEEVAALWRDTALEPRPFGGSYDHLYLDIYPPSMQSADMSHVPNIQPLRPVAFAGHEDAPTEIAHTDARPLVYLTFGTTFNQNATFRTAVDTIRALDVRLLVTVGPNGDVDAFGPQPSNVRIERYVPQTQILEHCSLVASHAGSGTMLASLAHGIPNLLLPQSADQFLNTAACAHAGAGIALPPHEATTDAIRDATIRLLDEPSFRGAARTVANEIASMPSPDDVGAVLETLA